MNLGTLAAPTGKMLFGRKPQRNIRMMANDEGQPMVPSGPIPGVRPTGSASISPDSPVAASGGIVATPEQRAQSEAVARQIGMEGATVNEGGSGSLGGSMRQPFDYDAAMKALVGERKDPKAWQYALAAIGDAIATNGGYSPYAVQNLNGIRNDNAARQFEAAKQIVGWQQGDWQRQNEADLRAANPFTVGRERVAYDPSTGEANVLYRGRQDAEIYADSLGFDRGSEEWNAAAEDFVLRGSGPSAHSRDLELDDYRTANDRGLEGYRQQNRLEMERARQGNRAVMEDRRQGNRVALRQTPSAGRTSSRRPTATDAKGNKVEWDGKAWVPAK